MRGMLVKSSVLAAAFGASIVIAALSASTLSIPDAKSGKTDRLYPLQRSACPTWDCEKDEPSRFITTMETDQANGVTTLMRSRVPSN
ncbi:hypothetical protein L1787_24935 [Acuticoccus sp. M5D2P5]|uniref:hypothetical protein n=1 Tax=Acuticoccus kalidii TaxID=2910977 RepID=UPI001F221135|nr:hypothetical protein [Acuticoccus kalidii]MCF3936642.1 hypothetical protein [Acuticoccus kalidii]